MKRFCCIAFALTALLSAQTGFCSSTDDVSHALANTSPKNEGAQSGVSAYIEFTPFEWESCRSVPRQEVVDSLHKAIRIGLDKAQATSTRISIIRLTSPSDIQTLRTLLKARPNMPHTRMFTDTRFLFDADHGETQIFVDQNGLASQGTHLWQLAPEDFTQLKQTLNRIYSEPQAPK